MCVNDILSSTIDNVQILHTVSFTVLIVLNMRMCFLVIQIMILLTDYWYFQRKIRICFSFLGFFLCVSSEIKCCFKGFHFVVFNKAILGGTPTYRFVPTYRVWFLRFSILK